MSARFPLAWPAGWKRTPPGLRKAGKFREADRLGYTGPVSVPEAVRRVLGELERFGVVIRNGDEIVISSNLIVGRHGLPLADQKAPADPGAAVYWRDGPASRAIACDVYDRAADNLAAIAASLEAMRAIERHGGAQILSRVFTGFDALPAPKSCWEILHILPTNDRETIERAYRVRAMKTHPDAGGTAAAFAELTEAKERALYQAGFK